VGFLVKMLYFWSKLVIFGTNLGFSVKVWVHFGCISIFVLSILCNINEDFHTRLYSEHLTKTMNGKYVVLSILYNICVQQLFSIASIVINKTSTHCTLQIFLNYVIRSIVL